MPAQLTRISRPFICSDQPGHHLPLVWARSAQIGRIETSISAPGSSNSAPQFRIVIAADQGHIRTGLGQGQSAMALPNPLLPPVTDRLFCHAV